MSFLSRDLAKEVEFRPQGNTESSTVPTSLLHGVFGIFAMLARHLRCDFIARQAERFFEQTCFIHLSGRAIDAVHTSASFGSVDYQNERFRLRFTHFNCAVGRNRSTGWDVRFCYAADMPTLR